MRAAPGTARGLRRGPRRLGPPLFLRALRWRLGLAVAVWACAVVVCAGAALGPVFALAADESGFQDVLTDAGSATGLRLQGVAGGSTQLTVPEAQARLALVAREPAVAHRPDRLGTLYFEGRGTAAGRTVPMLTRTAWRAGACSQVVLTAGRCPSAPGEAMISARSAAAGFGWHLGGTVDLADSAGTDPAGDGITTRVVGIYRPKDTGSPRWSGTRYFQSSVQREQLVTDAVFVSRATFARLPRTAIVQEWTDLPLDVPSVRLADATALGRQAASLGGRALQVGTGLPAVLARASTLRSRTDTAIALVIVQLCVLGWLVLHRVLLDAVEARSADIALAKLRGFPRGALLRFGLGEPTLLLLAAVPVGALLAFAGGAALAGSVLRAGTPVVFPATALAALVVATLGGFVAVVHSARGALDRSVLDQWRRTRIDQRGSRVGLLVDAAAALAAALAFLLLRLAGPDRTGPLVLLGPGLLVTAVGLASARLLPVALRPLLPATAWSRAVALLLAVRQVARRPAGLRLVALLTVAVGLAVFGVGGQAVAAQNRTTRAAAELGASEVVPLLVTPGDDVVSEVRRADPGGRWAAAAASWLPFGGSVRGTVLAVDAARLPAVAAAAPGLPSPTALARQLRSGAVAPIRIRGTRIATTIAVTDRSGGPAPSVQLDLRRPDGSPVAAAAGALRTGTHTYTAAIPCGRGCTLAGVTWSRSVEANGTVSGTAVVSSFAVDGRPLRAGLTSRGAWRAESPAGQASDHVTIGSGGITDRFSAEFGGSGGLVHGDLVDPVPALVTPAAVRRSAPGTALTTTSSDGTVARLRVVAADGVLPVVGSQGAVVDLGSFQSALPTFAADATWSVWVGPHAPPDALARLRAAGLSPDGSPVRLAARVQELARQGPALALLLLLATAVSGALLAIGGTAVSIGAALRRRSYEAAALAVIGVTRAQVYRAALAEQLLLLGTSVVVGLPAGLLAMVLALPAVPEFADATPVPLRFLPPAAPVALFTVLFAALVVLTGALSAALVVRAAGADRLREAEE